MNKKWGITVAVIVVLAIIVIGLRKWGLIDEKQEMFLSFIFSIAIPLIFLFLWQIPSNKKNTTTPEKITNKTVEKLIEKGILPPADIVRATAQVKAIEEDIQRDLNPSRRKKKAEKEFFKGNIDKALQMLNSDALANDAEQTGGEYRFKAQLLELKKDFPEAERQYRRAVEIYPSPINTFALAYCLQLQNCHEEAERYYLESLEKASDDDKRAKTLNNLGVLYVNTNQYLKAETAYNEALEICWRLSAEKSAAYEGDVALTLNNLGVLHKDTNQHQKAEAEHSEALEIYRRLADKNLSAYEGYVAMTLNNLASLHWETNQYPEAEKENREALEIYRRLADKNPAAYEWYVATTLHNLANLHSDLKAEKEFREALEIFRRLAKENPTTYEGYVATTLNNLANLLYKDTNQYPEAEKEYNEALEIRRRLAKENPSAYEGDIAGTLNNLGNLHKNTKQYSQAEKEYNEALEIFTRLAQNSPEVFQPYVEGVQRNLKILNDLKEQ
ncbi:MAG: tetratricopeptide repeat protein [Rikenellaceae bacterium]|jgi:tetratricopeptide (TPR) repeat protein|nr:tetratricopeptide repeat protein [Rikenellaceae bacterium]